MRSTTEPAPSWAVWSTWLLSLTGLGLAIYLTIAHFAGSQILACSDKGLVDCASVTTSPESYFLGIPVAILGLINFVVLAALTSPWVWRLRASWIALVRWGVVVGGMLFVFWLLAVEFLILNRICIYCTGVHIVTLALFIILSRVTPAQIGWVSGEVKPDVPSR
ncbi:MAG: vitamin K epoxide reductase family protein [Acidimicrobiaceae bacterium]|nr:vitamin K epoxide reductase family protein [Acidimicrobiaceae bacterium]